MPHHTVVALYAPGLGLLVGACGPSAGARPTDMSASKHEAVASAHESEGAGHAAGYDSAARAEKDRCASPAAKYVADVCWTSVTNPTEEHRRAAEAHRKIAAEHRAAAAALREAEARACVGLAEADRDTSPFHHVEDVIDVETLTAYASGGRSGVARTTGTAVTIRAVPGLTKEYLQRLVDCHLARNASMGFAMPEMATCPLSVKGAEAKVESGSSGFRVEIRSSDNDAVIEIVKRARALKKT